MTDPAHQTYHVVIPSSAAGDRLDGALARGVPALSRSRLKSLIQDGRVRLETVDGQTILDPNYRVKPGQTFAILIPEPEPPEPVAQPIALDVVYEDEHLIVVDKPAGMVVHPGAGNPDLTLVNALLAHCGDTLSGIGGVSRPGIVHRLDKDTSGLIVAAKSDAAHKGLSALFAGHDLERGYKALVWGVPRNRKGKIDTLIGRNPRNRKKMGVVKGNGKRAVTRYSIEAVYDTFASMADCRLETGRTHQIRVHMAHIGHPVIGDPLYGRGRAVAALPPALRETVAGFKRQALHAYLLGFDHPISGEMLRFTSKLPRDMRHLIKTLETI